MNKSGPIRYTSIQNVRITSSPSTFHQECSEFYVTSIGTHNLILGTNWLKAHNPELNWSSSCLVFSHCPSSCSLSHSPLSINPLPLSFPSTIVSHLLPKASVDPDSLAQ